MYEIWSLGHKPFEEYGNTEVSQWSREHHTLMTCTPNSYLEVCFHSHIMSHDIFGIDIAV